MPINEIRMNDDGTKDVLTRGELRTMSSVSFFKLVNILIWRFA